MSHTNSRSFPKLRSYSQSRPETLNLDKYLYSSEDQPSFMGQVEIDCNLPYGLGIWDIHISCSQLT